MEYIVLKNGDLDGLINEVNKYIKQGWMPQGGICESGTDNFLFFQAMIKK